MILTHTRVPLLALLLLMLTACQKPQTSVPETTSSFDWTVLQQNTLDLLQEQQYGAASTLVEQMMVMAGTDHDRWEYIRMALVTMPVDIATPLIEQAYKASQAIYTQDVTDIRKVQKELWKRAKAKAGNGLSIPQKPEYLKDAIDKKLFARAKAVIYPHLHQLIDIIEKDEMVSLVHHVDQSDALYHMKKLSDKKVEPRYLANRLAERGRKENKAVGGMLPILDSDDRWEKALDDMGSYNAQKVLAAHVTAVENDRKNKRSRLLRYIELFKKGDADGIVRLERERTNAFPKLQETVFDARNKYLGATLLHWADSAGTYLVILDTAAIAGKTGVAAQLKKAGFKVRRLNAGETLKG